MSDCKMVLKLSKSMKTGDWRDMNIAHLETAQLGHTAGEV